MPIPEWEARPPYPRFREIDDGDQNPRLEPSRSYPRFTGVDEPDPYSNGETTINSEAIEPDLTRPAPGRAGKGRTLALVVVAGMLAVSIGLMQRGTPNLSPPQSAKPLPPIAARTNRIDRGEKAKAQVDLVTPPGIVGEAATASPAVITPHLEPASATRTPQQRSAPRIALRTSTSAPHSRSSRLCDGLSGLDLARCMRPQILDADRELRDAYYDAVRVGVERHVLVAYQREWSIMRHRAISDPRSVADDYRQMADELNALQPDRRADDF